MNAKIRSGKRALAVLTSGGDAPGMNAAVRAVARAGLEMGMDVWGIERGYAGMLEGQFLRLDQGSVGNILQRGGTVLRTARSEEFMTKAGRARGARELSHRDIDTLVTVGGDGTFRGAALLAEEQRIKVIGIPGTIDNDVALTDSTIGYDTAVNTALDAIDRIRDTAAAHERFFIIEVMGRNSGHIAIEVGLACGAEAILIRRSRRTSAPSPTSSSAARRAARPPRSSSPPRARRPARSTRSRASWARSWASSCASSCSGTSSAAAAPPPATASWPRAWAPPRRRRPSRAAAAS
ncbi:MAG TPA: ATP-dependent 6-phosphofructokinase [Myxococcales bacterium]|jgi:6-phosphofructokinase